MKICSPLIQCGLGNILFKIASAYAYSLKNNYDFLIYRDLCFDSPHARFDEYINTIFSKIKFVYEDPLDLPFFREKTMLYREVPNFDTGFYMDGQFQSSKYFLGFEDDIIDLFKTNLTNFNGDKVCSIHVRRGDYVAMPHRYVQLDLNYYRKACRLMPKDNEFLIFSNDIEWCKKNFTKQNGFKNINFAASNNPSYIDLELMSKCENNITANSTFSWWGAFLNQNNNKIVVTPKQWITQHLANLCCEGRLKQYMNDLLLNEWIKI